MSVTRDELHATVATATGNPESGPMFDALDAITEALDTLINGTPTPKVEDTEADVEPVKVASK